MFYLNMLKSMPLKMKIEVMDTPSTNFYSSPKEVEAFEVEMTQFDKPTSHWLITKICLRTRYSPTQDVCLSIRTYRDPITKKYSPSKALIVTAWLNHRNDAHTTLDESKYVKEEDLKEKGLL